MEPQTPITFSLKFLDPATGQTLEHVNYSFTIEDVSGNKVHNSLNQHTEDGLDTQTVTFPKTGALTLVIDVKGLGIESPFDTTYAGKTSAVITVVPEFPIGILVVMGLAMIAVIILGKFKGYLTNHSNIQ